MPVSATQSYKLKGEALGFEEMRSQEHQEEIGILEESHCYMENSSKIFSQQDSPTTERKIPEDYFLQQ